jgi:hypothetical protein
LFRTTDENGIRFIVGLYVDDLIILGKSEAMQELKLDSSSKDSCQDNWKLQIFSLRPTPTLKYLPGKANIIADTASRFNIRLLKIRHTSLELADVNYLAKLDEDIRKYLLQKQLGEFDDSVDDRVKKLSRRYWLTLFQTQQVGSLFDTNKKERRRLILLKHEELKNGHPRQVHQAISGDIRWHSMYEEITTLLARCSDCQRGLNNTGKPDARPCNFITNTSKLPIFAELDIDLIELPEEGGLKFMLVAKGRHEALSDLVEASRASRILFTSILQYLRNTYDS